ncbi:related to amino acid transport protein [Ustilago trichophora]|uniref:Related to amino acid transport protein n=1 Tax=Ustilago trichophora TaxID=86804 RepID=A0A5C3EBK6_9BASI|nr:related to amino acid transport protein [Ustilago trichophora]
MPARTNNKGIPVPRDAAHASSRGRGGGGGDNQQPAWRSSLDLVWSYSRSQAFYGNNIATSPSFVERRWAGQDLEEGDSLYDDDREYISEDEESEYDGSTSHSRSGTDADTDADTASMASDARFGPSDEFEWEGEALPPNATQRSRRRGSKARDRRLEQLESADEDERSRSRSRSPKRLAGPRERASNSKLNPNRISTASGVSAAGDVLRDPFAEDEAEQAQHRGKDSEATPLLSRPRASDASLGKNKPNSYGALGRASESGAVSARSESGYQPLELGNSTLLQSWFNTVNALVGVGILALPLAFSYAGWIGGTVLFLVCGLLTNYTGKVLAKIMSKEPSLRTYADIGSYAFGPSARILISLFFCLELWAVSVALIILFGDSMAAIFPEVAPAAFKILGYCLVLPTVFLPLKFLSPISVIGIVSTFTLVVVVISDGLIKRDAPGSLFSPAPTTLGPRWDRLPLSFGLIMSGFSSHPIIPSLVRDMKDPGQFPRMLNLAYVAATVLYLSMGMVGYAMFGLNVSDEITKDLARTEGFPVVLNSVAIWLIVINPLSKFALATRPIQTTFEILLGIDDQTAARVDANKLGKGRRRSSAARSIKAQCSRVEGQDTTDQQLITEATNTTLSVSLNNANAGRVSFATPTTAPSHTTEPELHPISEGDPLSNSAISLRAAALTSKLKPRTRHNLQTFLKIALTALITLTAVVLPGFEQVMAFLGAFLAFATCVFGPLLANLKLFGAEMRGWRIAVDVGILAMSAVMAATGTAWAFL